MDTAQTPAPALTGYVVTRLLLSAYFISLSVGLISGTDVSILYDDILPPPLAKILSNGVLFIAAVALVIGWYRTVAVFVLSSLLFAASYIGLNEMPYLLIGPFWRDLALIAIVMMTYSDTDPVTNDLLVLKNFLPKETPKKDAQNAATGTRVLSRGSVQRAYTVNKSGRAMSRKVRESEAHAFSEELEAATKLR